MTALTPPSQPKRHREDLPNIPLHHGSSISPIFTTNSPLFHTTSPSASFTEEHKNPTLVANFNGIGSFLADEHKNKNPTSVANFNGLGSFPPADEHKNSSSLAKLISFPDENSTTKISSSLANFNSHRSSPTHLQSFNGLHSRSSPTHLSSFNGLQSRSSPPHVPTFNGLHLSTPTSPHEHTELSKG